MKNRLRKVLGALTKRTRDRLMSAHSVDSTQRLVNHYDRQDNGLRDLVGELNKQELCKSLTVLDQSDLQAVVYGALAFDSKLKSLIRTGRKQGNSRDLKGIMKVLCGWNIDRFKEPTYVALIEMLNRVGVDVEEHRFDHLEKKRGGHAGDRRVRLRRMFPDVT